jgi:Fe-S cluster biogenesis protein NfuA
MASSPPEPEQQALGAALAGQFDRMVRRDGGSVSLLGVDGGVIRVAYHPGIDPTCDDGSCVLPQVELQQLMTETLTRRHDSMRVVVELVP